MSEQMPNPIDLKPIPYFPFEPTLQLALIVLAILCVLLVGIYFWLRSRHRPASTFMRVDDAILRAGIDLKRLIELIESSPKEVLTDGSAIVKRLLAALKVAELRERTPFELKRLSERDAPPKYRKLISVIAQMDELRFSPTINANVARDRIVELLGCVNELTLDSEGNNS